MISIYLGSQCLLKAEVYESSTVLKIRDLQYAIDMDPDTHLSSLLMDNEIAYIRNAGTCWLEINHAGTRQLELSCIEDETGWDAIVEFENGDAASIFDVTLKKLFMH